MSVDEQTPSGNLTVEQQGVPQKPEPKEGYVYKYLKKSKQWKAYKKPVTKIPAPEVAK